MTNDVPDYVEESTVGTELKTGVAIDTARIVGVPVHVIAEVGEEMMRPVDDVRGEIRQVIPLEQIHRIAGIVLDDTSTCVERIIEIVVADHRTRLWVVGQ